MVILVDIFAINSKQNTWFRNLHKPQIFIISGKKKKKVYPKCN